MNLELPASLVDIEEFLFKAVLDPGQVGFGFLVRLPADKRNFFVGDWYVCGTGSRYDDRAVPVFSKGRLIPSKLELFYIRKYIVDDHSKQVWLTDEYKSAPYELFTAIKSTQGNSIQQDV